MVPRNMLVLTLMLLSINSGSALSQAIVQPRRLQSPHSFVFHQDGNLRTTTSKRMLNNSQNVFGNLPSPPSTSSSMALHMQIPRGGALSSLNLQTPDGIYNSAFGGLTLIAVLFKILQQQRATGGDNEDDSSSEKDTTKTVSTKPAAVKSLQYRFLLVFWLLRCADWLQGPYFYDVYKSKVFNGVPATMGIISKIFLAGFASTAIFGPFVGQFADVKGRKKGTLAFCALYTLGALSTKSTLLTVLLLGRLVNGIGTSLLFSAPEAWLVGESLSIEDGGKYLGETFGLAYAGDSIVAILAGKLSGIAASQKGPTGPFELSTIFLAAGAILTTLLWKENVASNTSDSESESKPTIREAVKVVQSDPKIMLVGAVQSLFEAAMYIFVLQWPPAITSAIAKAYPGSNGTPYGTIFSCFMACCLLGSTTFSQLVNKMSVSGEKFSNGMLTLATLSMAAATFATTSMASFSPAIVLSALSISFFLFESCVGMYFPSIGTLRSKYVPDSHRSVILNLFGIPLNALVVTVFLVNEKLGVGGALSVSTGALGLASLCMMKLRGIINKQEVPVAA